MVEQHRCSTQGQPKQRIACRAAWTVDPRSKFFEETFLKLFAYFETSMALALHIELQRPRQRVAAIGKEKFQVVPASKERTLSTVYCLDDLNVFSHLTNLKKVLVILSLSGKTFKCNRTFFGKKVVKSHLPG